MDNVVSDIKAGLGTLEYRLERQIKFANDDPENMHNLEEASAKIREAINFLARIK